MLLSKKIRVLILFILIENILPCGIIAQYSIIDLPNYRKEENFKPPFSPTAFTNEITKYEPTCDGGPCKKNTSYERIQLKLDDNNLVYAKGKINKDSKLELASHIRYVSNDSIYGLLKPGKNQLYSNSSFFYSNGNPMFQQEYLPSKAGISRDVYFSQDGRVIFALTEANTWSRNVEDKMMKYSLNSPHDAILPDYYKVDKKHTYSGFYLGGTLIKNSGETFTGFMLPTLKHWGGTSLLYVQPENELQGGYWATVSGGIIERTYNAFNAPIPDMATIIENHNINAISITGLYKKAFNKELGKMPRHSYVDDFEIVEIAPKDPNYTGYGITITSEYLMYPGNVRNIEMGFYKNGKLNGPGSRMKVAVILYNKSEQTLAPENRALLSGEIGIFENGNLTSGRKLDMGIVDFNYDYISKPELPNIAYKDTYPIIVPMITENPVPVSSLRSGSKIYLPKSNREFKIIHYDQQTGTIITESDFPGKTITITKEHGDVYYLDSYNKGFSVYCPPTEIRYTYKTVPVTINYQAPKTDTRKVKMAEGTMYYTTKYYTNESLHLYDKQVKSGSEVVRCSKCNGTGSLNYTSNNKLYRLIAF